MKWIFSEMKTFPWRMKGKNTVGWDVHKKRARHPEPHTGIRYDGKRQDSPCPGY
jgi:hypothetical protein